MTIFETFSKRQKKQNRKNIKNVYEYNNIPQKLRVQVIHILDDCSLDDNYWKKIHNIIAREKGVFILVEGRSKPYHPIGYKKIIIDFILNADVDGFLDIVELFFKIIRFTYQDNNMKDESDEIIKELNHRFKEHGIGYEFIEEKLIKIDSKYIHKETIKPAIKLLYEEEFKGANEEFFKAHKHYRKGNHKESIGEALKAFESTMKTICKRKQFEFQPDKDTASKLIKILIDNELIPRYLSCNNTGIRTTLQSGLPTLRNKTSSHGQGENLVKISKHFVEYALNLSATNIIFLIENYKESK
mgnify:CR=1 FL=1